MAKDDDKSIIESLKAEIEALKADKGVLEAEKDALKAEIEALEAEIADHKSTPPRMTKGKCVANVYGFLGDDGHRMFYPGQVLTEDEVDMLTERGVELVDVV